MQDWQPDQETALQGKDSRWLLRIAQTSGRIVECAEAWRTGIGDRIQILLCRARPEAVAAEADPDRTGKWLGYRLFPQDKVRRH